MLLNSLWIEGYNMFCHTATIFQRHFIYTKMNLIFSRLLQFSAFSSFLILFLLLLSLLSRENVLSESKTNKTVQQIWPYKTNTCGMINTLSLQKCLSSSYVVINIIISTCNLILLRSLEPKIKVSECSQVSFCKVTKNKRHHRKWMLFSFHLSGHTWGFHPKTRKRKPPCTAL